MADESDQPPDLAARVRRARQSTSPMTRTFAVMGLGMSDDADVEPLLWKFLDDPDEAVRAGAAAELVRRDPGRDPALLLRHLRGTDDESPPTADEIVAFNLSGLKSADVVTPLVEALRASEGTYRPDLLRALASTQQVAALEPLSAALHGSDERTRRFAPLVFGTLWPLGEAALRPLLAVATGSADAEQRENAFVSLGQYLRTSDEAIEALITAALSDPNRKVRAAASNTAAGHAEQTRPYLDHLLQSGDATRRRRAHRILRQMRQRQRSLYLPSNYANAPRWRKAAFTTSTTLRSLPGVAALLSEDLRARRSRKRP